MSDIDSSLMTIILVKSNSLGDITMIRNAPPKRGMTVITTPEMWRGAMRMAVTGMSAAVMM